MSKCKLVNMSDAKAPPMPSIDSILEFTAQILRDKTVYPARYESSTLYWILRFLGCSKIPVGECEEPLRLERLGFYELGEYSKLNIARNPMELVLAAKPTPLVGVKLVESGGPTVWAKLEWYNPYSLSMKDRVAWQMIKLALEQDEALAGIVEASSSNTGIALAALASILGIPAEILIPRMAPLENERILKLLGAKVERRGAGVTSELIDAAKQYALERGMYNPNQFENDANILAHMRYTARELLLQVKNLDIRPSALVLPSGTSGTSSAVSFLFNNYFGNIDTYIVVPAPGETIEGIRRLETGVKWLNRIGVDYQVVEVTRREALTGMKNMARLNGIVPGVSGGAVFSAIKRLWENKDLSHDIVDGIVTIIPDTGFKYPQAIKEALEDG